MGIGKKKYNVGGLVGIPTHIHIEDPEARRVAGALADAINRLYLEVKSAPVDEQKESLTEDYIKELIADMIRQALAELDLGDGGGSVQYLGANSVVRRGNVFSLDEDEPSPDADSYYGTDSDGERGWHALPAGGANHSFRFSQTSSTGGNITAGAVYISGVSKTITDLPASLSGVTTSTKYYIQIELATSTAQWKSTTGAYPASDDDTEIWPILEITCADSVISTFVQRQCSDIHITKAA